MITLTTIKFIKEEEGVRYAPYNDTGKVKTFGIGSTNYETKLDSIYGKGTAKGILDRCQKDRAYSEEIVARLFRYDLEDAQRRLHKELDVTKLNYNQYGSLISIIFNCGTLKVKKNGIWAKSSLMYYIEKENWKDAAEEIRHFKIRDKAGNEVLKNRRAREAALFASPIKKEVQNNYAQDIIKLAEALEPKPLEMIA